MTAGYDPSAGQPGEPAPVQRLAAYGRSPEPGDAGPPYQAAPQYGVEQPGQDRPGPTPPRFEPPAPRTWSDGPTGPGVTGAAAGYPTGAAPAYSSGAAPGHAGGPAVMDPDGNRMGYSGSPAPAGYPAHPGNAAPTGYPVAPTSSGYPGAAYPISAPPPGGTYPIGGSGVPAFGHPEAASHGPAPAAGPSRGPGWPRIIAGLMGLLVVLAGVQAYQINRLSDRLSRTDRQLADGQRADAGRLDGLAGRTDALEKQAGTVFNPEAVASQVLPSVFRVRAGQFTGTAFAIGKPAAGGGTNLFTNFHVVESVWKSGGRKVDLERTDQRFPATIVKVDQTNDVAQLRTDGSFTGLTPAPEAVKSGQQIVVVGAPLGLEDTVTTGVVSAFRQAEDKSGPVVQFDAPINPGNSGGPVINGAKQVVGIATAKARNAEGIGLAIPIKTACDSIPIC